MGCAGCAGSNPSVSQPVLVKSGAEEPEGGAKTSATAPDGPAEGSPPSAAFGSSVVLWVNGARYERADFPVGVGTAPEGAKPEGRTERGVVPQAAQDAEGSETGAADDADSFCTARSHLTDLHSETVGPTRWKCEGLGSEPPVEKGLLELRQLWQERIRPGFAPEIDADPYLSPPDVDTLLLRFLQAERNERSKDPVSSAAARLQETATFRRDYRCVDFHRRGMARKLLMHGSNAGASAYFGDYGLRDCDGEPVLVGRISLMTSASAPGRKTADNMIPCTHLRAALFICERAALETRDQGSYILDLGDFPAKELAAYSHSRYWDADGVVDDFACVAERRRPVPSVGPHLPQHETMPGGLPVLKESLRCMTAYYPQLLKRVYFYNPGFRFRAVFRIFSLWVPADTRRKFVMVAPGEEHRHFLAPGVCRPAEVPPELGGSGPPLDGDRFLAAAVARYDATARLPPAG